MVSASELGIYPPSTVRIDMGGWVQDWPFECVVLYDDLVLISHSLHLVSAEARARGVGLVHYCYEHAHQQDDGSWLFIGREDFTITAGPAQPLSMDTAAPQ